MPSWSAFRTRTAGISKLTERRTPRPSFRNPVSLYLCFKYLQKPDLNEIVTTTKHMIRITDGRYITDKTVKTTLTS